MNKPNYVLLKGKMEENLRELENMILYLEKSQYDPTDRAYDLSFSLLEVKFAMQRSVEHLRYLSK